MFASVLLPLPLDGPFHYGVPSEFDEQITIGMRVLVSFGAKRFYTGIVSYLSDRLPAGIKANKQILQLIDDEALLTTDDLAFHQWMATYYLCTNGEVLRSAIPSALLPESRTMVYATPNFEAEEALPEADSALLDILHLHRGKAITIEELRRQFGRAAIPSFTRLLECGAIRLNEEIHRRYRPRMRRLLRLAEVYRSDDALTALLDNIKRATRQTALLLSFLDRCQEAPQGYETAFAYDDIRDGDPKIEAAIVALRKRGVLLVETEAVSRVEAGDEYKLRPLTKDKVMQLDKAVSVYYGQDIFEKERQLEMLIAQTMARGGQVLLMSPDVRQPSTGGAFLSHLSTCYGANALTYSASVSDAVRIETYRRTASTTDPLLVIAGRSGIFLPFRNLALIIIDEEQEYGYKQQNPAPRYHARDAAIVLAGMKGAKVLLSSACPSSETLLNISTAKWQRIGLSSAIRPIPVLAAAEVINTSVLATRLQMKGTDIISPPLEQAISQALTARKRVLLIQNRRGYASYMTCTDCGGRILCPHCDVSLTYHKQGLRLLCHYCGYTEAVPRFCPSCRRTDMPTLRPIGNGVERAEEEVARRFPTARIIRIDADVALSKKRMSEIYMRIEDGEVDIIIGTQMIKSQPIWHDIAVIGILRLDSLLAFPDFRSDERAFQLLFRLALCSSIHPTTRSRLADPSELPAIPRLIIQTADPEQRFIQELRSARYDAFIAQELDLRYRFGWPPYYRLTTVIVKASEEALAEETAVYLHNLLRRELNEEAISPVFAPSIARIDLQYIRHILLRRPLSSSHISERQCIRQCVNELHGHHPRTKRARIIFDVDPL